MAKDSENIYEQEGDISGIGKLTQFFTPELVADKMLALAQHYGFKGGNVLEPSAGNGRLINRLKDCNITAFEIDTRNFDALKKGFPNAKLYNEYFETAFLLEPRFNRLIDNNGTKTWLKDAPFDLVISNPPYGKFNGKYFAPFIGLKFYSKEQLFIKQSMKLVKKDGLGVFLLPSSFLRNGNTYNQFKQGLFQECKLVDAYRMPNNIFKDTSYATDIVVLQKK